MTREDRNEMRIMAAAAVDLFDGVRIDPQHVVELVDDVERAESSAARLREGAKALAKRIEATTALLDAMPSSPELDSIRVTIAGWAAALRALSSSAGADGR